MLATQALVPVFLLILLGQVLYRCHFPAEGFWQGAERLTYYVLFPAMLVYKLGSAQLPGDTYLRVGAVVALVLLIMVGLLLLVQWWVRWPGPVFTSLFQGSIRFNSFVGLAVAEGIHGQAGLALTAVAAATMIPLLNLLCILAFAGYVSSTPVRPWPVLRTVIRNPLILPKSAMAFGAGAESSLSGP